MFEIFHYYLKFQGEKFLFKIFYTLNNAIMHIFAYSY